jgi:RecA/RadA recombinase
MFSLANLVKQSNNVFASIAVDEVCGDVKSWVDTGSYSLNALVSGSLFKGFPSNKIIGLIGAESVGKTYFALSSCKRFQNSDEKAVVICFETEAALTRDMLESRGIDLNRFAIFPVATVQEFKTQCLTIVDEYLKEDEPPPLMVILDSLGNLSTVKEMADSASGADTRDMTRAQIVKAAFRVLSLKLGAARIPMILTNHVYDNIGGGLYAAKEQSGGSGPKYAASIIIGLTKAKDKEGDETTGSIITCTTIKSRLTREQLKVKCLIRFNGGLDRYYGLIDLAEKAGAFKKVSTRFELPDGTKVFGKAIERNPEKYFTADVLDKIEQYVDKNFRYGVASASTDLESIEEEETDE